MNWAYLGPSWPLCVSGVVSRPLKSPVSEWQFLGPPALAQEGDWKEKVVLLKVEKASQASSCCKLQGLLPPITWALSLPCCFLCVTCCFQFLSLPVSHAGIHPHRSPLRHDPDKQEAEVIDSSRTRSNRKFPSISNRETETNQPEIPEVRTLNTAKVKLIKLNYKFRDKSRNTAKYYLNNIFEIF